MVGGIECRRDQMLPRPGHREALSRRVGAPVRNIERAARRRLLVVDAARSLDELRVPPGNRLEALKGDRRGQHSIRINDQWRICFTWTDTGPEDVQIVDYH